MTTSEQGPVSSFAAIRQADEQGNEYWSARDLAKALDYARWDRFKNVIEKAEVACENSGHAASDHFSHVGKMIETGKGGHRDIGDILLSRYACYLIVQNADPSKEIVALGQTYFAVQTRRAEVADELAEPTEAQRRLYIRGQLREHNRELAAAAQDAGVIQPRDFAIFQDHGYRGLYNGEGARDIAARKGVRPGQILEYMGSTELAANLFRATQTEEKLRREGIQGKDAANRTHHAVGREVRATIERLGGTMPEDLPTPNQSIQQVQRTEQQRLAAERQPGLFIEPSDE